MMTNDWLQQQINALAVNSEHYEEQALFRALAELVTEQEKRIEQTQGEIDGRTWDERQW
ncbi:hypothetical protein [Loigolactobacillus backii]|uniref:hypothetical protein n=1 Tax=Loigolactobacillus backii TaxID=375175 RepID=UPI00142FE0D0|nr:hypothetical protein [Loigolactobacillus backii]